MIAYLTVILIHCTSGVHDILWNRNSQHEHVRENLKTVGKTNGCNGGKILKSFDIIVSKAMHEKVNVL